MPLSSKSTTKKVRSAAGLHADQHNCLEVKLCCEESILASNRFISLRRRYESNHVKAGLAQVDAERRNFHGMPPATKIVRAGKQAADHSSSRLTEAEWFVRNMSSIPREDTDEPFMTTGLERIASKARAPLMFTSSIDTKKEYREE